MMFQLKIILLLKFRFFIVFFLLIWNCVFGEVSGIFRNFIFEVSTIKDCFLFLEDPLPWLLMIKMMCRNGLDPLYLMFL